VKVRASGRIVSVAVIVGAAVNGDGWREVLGIAIGASEAETFWTEFLRSLARRGLRGVRLVISDAHEGGSKRRLSKSCTPPGSVAAYTPCAMSWRMPASRAGVSLPPSSPPLLPRRTPKWSASNGARWPNQLRPKVAKLAILMDQVEADVLAFMSFPKDHRPKIHSTNPLGRLNGEIKRRIDVVGIFLTRTPSPAWSARSCSSRTMNGRCSAPAT
jgi:putative transposase